MDPKYDEAMKVMLDFCEYPLICYADMLTGVDCEVRHSKPVKIGSRELVLDIVEKDWMFDVDTTAEVREAMVFLLNAALGIWSFVERSSAELLHGSRLTVEPSNTTLFVVDKNGNPIGSDKYIGFRWLRE